MKKLLLGSAVLTIFSISLIIFQISCKKEADAQMSSGLTQLNKIVFQKYSASTNTEIWTANYDGTNQTKINIVLPPNYYIVESNCSLSPNGQKVFFTVGILGGGDSFIYTCNLDGSGLTSIVNGPSGGDIMFGGAY